jgi:hypothetical protein
MKKEYPKVIWYHYIQLKQYEIHWVITFAYTSFSYSLFSFTLIKNIIHHNIYN